MCKIDNLKVNQKKILQKTNAVIYGKKYILRGCYG